MSDLPATLPIQIEVEDLDLMRRENRDFFVLDVRERWEADICALPGSVNVPLSTLPQNLARLPPDCPLVVLCHHGMRSMQATVWLRGKGFANAVNLRGGIDAWARRVDPAIATY
jgi:rhodanese-related sulfurtransferase